MQYREYGRTATKVSALGFGCMRLPTENDHVKEEYTIKMLRHAMNIGVNYFDSAVHYCKHESQVVLGKAIMISAYGRATELVEALRHGAFDYIEKPIAINELLARVRRAIENRRPAMRTEPCPKCNQKMQAGWQYCPYDGTKIT